MEADPCLVTTRPPARCSATALGGCGLALALALALALFCLLVAGHPNTRLTAQPPRPSLAPPPRWPGIVAAASTSLIPSTPALADSLVSGSTAPSVMTPTPAVQTGVAAAFTALPPPPPGVDPIGLSGRVGLLVFLVAFVGVSFVVLSQAFEESEVERSKKLARREAKRAKARAEDTRRDAEPAAPDTAVLYHPLPAEAPLAAVDQFYDTVLQNAAVRTALRTANVAEQRALAKEALAGAVRARLMGNARGIRQQGLTELLFFFLERGISGTDFDAVVDAMVSVMRQYQLPEEYVTEATTLAHSLHREVFG